MVYFDSTSLYIESQTTLEGKITAINACIDALINTMLKAADTANFSEYYLDDGQTKITTKYRDINQVTSGINALEKVKQIYVNRLNGRVFRAVDSKNFIKIFPCG